jgi:hypothetical protein
MKIINNQGDEYVLTVTVNELQTLNNALNEVCNGIPIEDFENRVGVPVAVAEQLLDSIFNALNSRRNN